MGTFSTPLGTHLLSLALRWDGSRLRVQNRGLTRFWNSQLQAVACPTATICFAVGFFKRHDAVGEFPLIERWDGRRWTLASAPAPDGNIGFDELHGISCPSARSCFAVGVRAGPVGGADGEPLIEHWDGAQWSLVTAPADGPLDSISCPGAQACTAVGWVSSQANGANGRFIDLAERWDGGRWTPSYFQPSFPARVSWVSCLNAATCHAVGVAYGPETYQGRPIDSVPKPISALVSGPSWPLSTLPLPRRRAHPPAGTYPPNGLLSGISCAGAHFCAAAGSSRSALDSDEPAVTTWSGSRWERLTVLPSPVSGADLQAVACPTAAWCLAVGQGVAYRYSR